MPYRWRKSSYSFSNGNCVEVRSWRKSTHSASNGCAQVAACGCGVLVRDSKMNGGPVLRFPPAKWAVFLAAVKRHQGS
jgi:hypothetical protein